MKRKGNLLLLPVVAYLFALFLTPAFAQKVSNSGLSIAPAVVEVSLTDPQEEKVLEFMLTNTSQHPLSLELYPINFNQKDEYGGVSFLGQDAGSYSYALASFLTFETLTAELNPGEQEVVRVTAKNRSDLSPGGHYAAVVARMKQPEGETSIAPAVSSLILLRKTGGEQYHLSLKELTWPKNAITFSYPGTIQLLFQNEGNVHLTPYGRIDVTDMFGRHLTTGIINESSAIVFPESRRYITAQFKTNTWSFPISLNKMQIRGQDSLNKITFVSTETVIYMHPLVPVGILAGGIGGVLFIRRKKKHSRPL